MTVDNGKWEAFKANPTAEALNNDPAYGLVNAFVKNYSANYLPKYTEFTTKTDELESVISKRVTG